MAKFGDRFFFALKPAAAALPQLATARRDHCPTHAIPDEHWHVTLDILDDVAAADRQLVDRLVTAGSRVESDSFAFALERIVGLGGWIGLRVGRRPAALMRLHAAIRAALLAVGLAPRRDWAFNPHLTLGYPHGAPFSHAIAPIGWQAEEIVLIHSHLGETRHQEIGRWALMPERQLSLF
ncbi:MAG: 2'-5' RNA ligase family protein [Sphingomonas sp.]|uniref:2'-5' RNA ligase family protein n=1 Tax=Sphingomonas sp. TaxID=28214 RepID=UPI001ACFBB94|nr:2'-5' RNA ligase family protein [Sphingomonas sp.]MBN8809244.1 2'-5' RNA ligase family protein [Sphingomonas sp.]